MYKGEKLTVDEMFTKARIILLKGDPFIGKFLLLLGVPIECSEEDKKENYQVLKELKTMATTGTKLYYNRAFVDKLEFDQFLSLLLHQLVHCVTMHPARSKGKNERLWNMAADLWVNERLKSRQYEYRVKRNIEYKIFGEDLTFDDDDINYMSVDDIYLEFLEQYNFQIGESKSQISISGEGDSGESGSDYKGGTGDCDIVLELGKNSFKLSEFELDMISPEQVGESSEDLIKKISEMNAVSNVHSNLVGQGTGLVKGEEIQLRRTQTKWYRYFDRFLSKVFEYETSYSTPDKNLLYTKRILKGARRSVSNKLSSVIIAMDFSASVWKEKHDLERFWFHIDNIMRKYKAEGRVLLWSTEVKLDLNLSKFNPNKEYNLPLGGTDPKCIYDYIEKYKIRYDVLLVLTDAYFKDSDLDFIEDRDDKNTMWIVSGDQRAFRSLQKKTIGKVYTLK